MSKKQNKRTLGTVLVADDESGIREVFTEMIGDLGYRVITAKDGEEAFKLAMAEQIKMAFIDIWMPPGIDGIALLDKWKEHGLLTFPVVVVSGYTDTKSTVEAMRRGATDVLDKPVDRKQIEALVRKIEDQAGSELFPTSVKGMAMGKGRVILKVKSGMLKLASTKEPVTWVGETSAGCEYFAMLMHAAGKPWTHLSNRQSLESSMATRLAESRNGTIYISGLERLNPNQQRGLHQLIRNAPEHGVRIACQSNESLDTLQANGKLSEELVAKLAPHEIIVPHLREYADDLPDILKTLSQRLAIMVDDEHPARFSAEALSLLADDRERWFAGGLAAVAGTMKVLLGYAANSEVSSDQVSRLLGAQGSVKGMDDDIFLSPLRDARKKFEQKYFSKLMERADDNFRKAAQMAGLERTYLYRKVEALQLVDKADDKEIST